MAAWGMRKGRKGGHKRRISPDGRNIRRREVGSDGHGCAASCACVTNCACMADSARMADDALMATVYARPLRRERLGRAVAGGYEMR